MRYWYWLKTYSFGIKQQSLTMNFLFLPDINVTKITTFLHVKQKCFFFYVVGNSESKRSTQSMEMLIRNGEANIDSDDEVELFNVRTDRHSER